jgi:hypothetical protein
MVSLHARPWSLRNLDALARMMVSPRPVSAIYMNRVIVGSSNNIPPTLTTRESTSFHTPAASGRLTAIDRRRTDPRRRVMLTFGIALVLASEAWIRAR